MNEYATEGKIFICGACGKRSKDLYGEQLIDLGWDESCMFNAVLCYDRMKLNSDTGIFEWVAVDIRS